MLCVGVVDEVLEVQEIFYTFVSSIDLCFGGAACSNLLASTDPVKGGIEEDDEARDGACIEQRKFCGSSGGWD